MTGAFGWHLPIWWGTSLPDIGWLAFHSPYSFYYSRNDSGSSDAQKMRLKIGEKVFGHTKKGGAFRLHHNGNFCYSSFACFHFPLTGEMQPRARLWRRCRCAVFISRSRARCNVVCIAAATSICFFISRSRARCNNMLSHRDSAHVSVFHFPLTGEMQRT